MRHPCARAVSLVIVLSALVTLASPAGASSGAAAEPPPGESGEVTVTPPPPDPEGDIDPDRPRDDGEITPLAAVVRPIRFPIRSNSRFVDTFGACRDGCSRRHEGIDIFAPRRTHLFAAADGHVTWLSTNASGTAGNGVGITDAQGWRYLYLHVNNDNPGTDDGANPARWRFSPGITMGAKVYAGQIIGYSGDSGNAETTPPHLHFEIRNPALVEINPYASLLNASRAPAVPRLFRFDSLRGGAANDHLAWATTRTTAIMACDTTGDGDDEPTFREGAVFWLSPEGADTRVTGHRQYGVASDRGICGDWDGNGTETPGVRRGNVFMLRNSWTAGPANIVYGYGRSTDQLVVGDWNDDGVDTVGVVRGNTWLLTNRNASGSATTTFTFGRSGDRAVVGDWDANGSDTPGVRRGTATYLRNASSSGAASIFIRVGAIGDATLVARWSTGTSDRDTISLWRRHPQ